MRVSICVLLLFIIIPSTIAQEEDKNAGAKTVMDTRLTARDSAAMFGLRPAATLKPGPGSVFVTDKGTTFIPADELDRKRRLTIIVLAGLLLLSVSGVLYILLHRQRERVRDREESLLAAARELTSKVSHLQQERQELQAYYASLQQAHFRELGDFYKTAAGADATNLNAKQAALYEKVRQSWNAVSSSKEEEWLFEQQLNARFDKVMEHLRKELPEHKEDYYRFAGYVFAGFDRDLLMALTGTSSRQSVYARKKRLRQDIVESEVPHKDQFLRLLV